MTCTHHLGTPGRPCPWACGAVVPAFVAAVAPPTAGHREGVSAGLLPAERSPLAFFADPAPTPATPCPALRLPVASHDANASHGAGSASLFDPPAARSTDPDTSHEAAENVTDRARRAVHRAVLEALVEHGPTTDHDLARYVSGKLGHPIGQTSVGVRRGELRNAGLVADSGHKGRTPTGAKAIRWALTPAGIDAVTVAA